MNMKKLRKILKIKTNKYQTTPYLLKKITEKYKVMKFNLKK